MKVFVSGLTSVETTLAVRGFPITYYPVDYPFFGIERLVAGSGYRAARGFKALGDDVTLVTLIGDDLSGKRIEDELNHYGLGGNYVFKTLTNTVEEVVLQEKPFGRRQVYCDLKDVQDKSVDVNAVKPAIERADVCAFLNVNFSRPLMAEAKALGKKIAVNVQALTGVDDKFNEEFIENADVLFMSDEGVSTSPTEFLAALGSRTNAEIIVMSRGKAGVMFCERDRMIRTLDAAPTDGDVINIGAGAALFSGFLHYYGSCGAVEALKRAEIFTALKLENGHAADKYPTAAEVDGRLEKIGF